MSLPAYVPRGGELVYRQPYQGLGARQHVFFLRGDPAALQATFDRAIAGPSAGAVSIRPYTSLVAITVLHIDTIRSTDPPDSEVGAGIEEHEVAIWTIGVERHRHAPVFFTPYLFVDSGMAMAAGREVFGLPKQDARFTITGSPTPELVKMDLLGVDRFSPTTPFAWRPALELRRVGPGSARAMAWRTLTDAARALGAAMGQGLPHLIEDAELAIKMMAILAGGSLPVLALKQFRDVAQPDRACYQAITESPIQVTAIHGGGLLGDYQLTVHDLDSVPIRRDLGLGPDPLTPLAAWWIDYDFRLEAGVERWNARA
ncbi:MAG TPA: acetoacetate decarboxylase family protein [Methylomirabilota bacterium]|nr:acetoacetate decarboxylase family protein [Methylomirabilota bacterium]